VLIGLPQSVGGFAIFHLICFSLFSQGAPGARRALVVSPFCFILVYFYNKHQVLVGLPQGVGGLVLLFYFVCFILFILFVFHFIYFI
jgi:hypothetical protein